ncbi:hypothetical protein [Klebsiella pneumoniae]|uniref:hypothetical protein n=1 Tax=Klebsiella pneumoniae TaxID=573 RepID=UPI00200E9D1E|nr:hypothetical protein [Klebsiella pneumoniae]UPZ02598.1 hypothetical protein MOV22_28360 [Klebsiella pneumoniae]
MAMVNEDIVVRLAQDSDIPEVKQLLERYHAKNLSGEQRANGFVTTDMTEQQLNELRSAESGRIDSSKPTCRQNRCCKNGSDHRFRFPSGLQYITNIAVY